MARKCLFRAKTPFRKWSKSFVGYTYGTHNLTPIFVVKKVRVVHTGLQTYKRFVAMPILQKFETKVNTVLFMYMNSCDVIICYLELRKTRSVFPIPLEFEIFKLACTCR